MENRPSYGRAIINALESHGVRVNRDFSYSDLPAHKKDAACMAVIVNNAWLPTECIPGCAQFGDHLAALFQNDPIFYAACLRQELIDHAKLDSSVSIEVSLAHSADLLNCEATVRAGIDEKQALMLLFSDPFEFVRIANNALVKYLNDFIEDEIQDVLREVVCH